ncbi:hypothetical protein [Thiofilum flexile]|uniref:hypothetical protein n=1 Tax=Thiofilum flexile TaxID=125627 RepID=UPI00037E272B|nr:hypothetical protein [Thiofilum flexile]
MLSSDSSDTSGGTALAFETFGSGAGTLTGQGGAIATTGSVVLHGTAQALNGVKAIAQMDYQHYINTGDHRSKRFEGVDWEKYGDNFEDAFKACPVKWCFIIF